MARAGISDARVQQMLERARVQAMPSEQMRKRHSQTAHVCRYLYLYAETLAFKHYHEGGYRRYRKRTRDYQPSACPACGDSGVLKIDKGGTMPCRCR